MFGVRSSFLHRYWPATTSLSTYPLRLIGGNSFLSCYYWAATSLCASRPITLPSCVAIGLLCYDSPIDQCKQCSPSLLLAIYNTFVWALATDCSLLYKQINATPRTLLSRTWWLALVHHRNSKQTRAIQKIVGGRCGLLPNRHTNKAARNAPSYCMSF